MKKLNFSGKLYIKPIKKILSNNILKTNNQLKTSSFISIILIVFIHANTVENTNDINPLTFWISDLISNGISRLAVPIFFMTSGFLFFNNKQVNFPTFYISQTKKRIKTILQPFVIWCTIGFILFAILQQLPYIKSIYNNFLLADLNFKSTIIHWIIYPVPFQLWFLQLLMSLVIATPLLWYSIKNKWSSYFILILMLLLWLKWGGYNGIGEYFFEGLLFFTTGAWISKFHNKLLEVKYNAILFYILFIVFLIIKSVLTINNYWQVSYLIGKIAIIIGIPAYWHFIQFLTNKFIRKNYSIMSYSFWLFLTHEPLLTFIKKGIMIVLPSSQIIVYFIAPIITILISLYSGKFISYYFPKLYSALTGGR